MELSAPGGLAGIAIATVAPHALSGALGVPYALDHSINLLSLVLSAANGVVSGCFQARRAAQMDPIEAPRRE